jgi:hypothetical protein
MGKMRLSERRTAKVWYVNIRLQLPRNISCDEEEFRKFDSTLWSCNVRLWTTESSRQPGDYFHLKGIKALIKLTLRSKLYPKRGEYIYVLNRFQYDAGMNLQVSITK